jgi:uncharacterized paraquat-inducible protein A
MVQIVPPEARGSVVECARCGNTLGRSVLGGIETSLAFSASALVLLLPAALAPLMSLVSFGATASNCWPRS